MALARECMEAEIVTWYGGTLPALYLIGGKEFGYALPGGYRSITEAVAGALCL